MIDLLFGPLNIWFGVPALVGTLFFVLRLAMVVMGIDFGDGDGGGGLDAGMDAGGGGLDVDAPIDEGLDHAESSSIFRFLSLQTITAFCMGFGWGGLLGLETFGYGVGASVGVGVLGGLAFAWFIVWCFKLMYAMESSGNISIREALGCEGVTASMIPAGGEQTGRVRLTIGDRQRAYGARTDGEEIRMGVRVRATRVNNDNTVTVVRV
jgi:hypothetical protein